MAASIGSPSTSLTIKSLPGLTDDQRATLKENKVTTIAKLRNSELFASMPAITKAFVLYPPENLEPKLAKKAAKILTNIIKKADPTSRTEVVGSIARCNKMLDSVKPTDAAPPPTCPPGTTAYKAEKEGCCEEAGDIDILTTASLAASIKALREDKSIEILSIYASGTKKTSMICRVVVGETVAQASPHIIKVDLFNTKNAETFPFAYLHYTKGKERNIALRNHAKAAGLKLNQESLTNVKTGEKHKFDDPKKIEAFLKNLKSK